MYIHKSYNQGANVAGYRIAIVLVFCTYSILSGCSERKVETNGDKKKPFNHAMDLTLPNDAEIRRDLNNGTVTFLKAKNLSEGLEQDDAFSGLQKANRYDEITRTFLSAYRIAFKLEHPADEFVVKKITTDDLGLKHVRFKQVFSRIPIWGSEIIIHLDQSNHVYLMQGRYIPTPSKLDITPVLSNDEVLRIVAENLEGKEFERDNSQPVLVVFVTEDNKPHLAYQVQAAISLIEGWKFFVDAKTGVILGKISSVYTGNFMPDFKVK